MTKMIILHGILHVLVLALLKRDGIHAIQLDGLIKCHLGHVIMVKLEINKF